MKDEKVRLILHIGQHKTGSKALQSYLAFNTKQLLKKGILYPISESSHDNNAYRNSHFNCYILARRDALLKCANVSVAHDFWFSHRRYCEPFLSLNQLFLSFEEERIKHGAHTIILSAEDLFDAQSAHEIGFSLELVQYTAQILLDAILKMNWEPEIAVYLRRSDYLINAQYAQYIKGDERNLLDFESFIEQFRPRLNSSNILKRWSRVFKVEKMYVIPYEKRSLPGGIVENFFQHILGFLPDNQWMLVPKDREYSNITPRRPYIDLLRENNIRKSRGHLAVSQESILSVAFKNQSKAVYQTSWISHHLQQQLLTQYSQDFLEIAKTYHLYKDQVPGFFKDTELISDIGSFNAKNHLINEDSLSFQELIELIDSMIKHSRTYAVVRTSLICFALLSTLYLVFKFLQ
jgi:hypothetical protein